MSQEGPEDTVVGLKSAYQNVPFVELPSQPGDLKVRTAPDLRTMQTMSYFHLNPPSTSTSKAQSSQNSQNRTYASWLASPLTTMRPWVVPYFGPESGILGVVCYDAQPPADLVADAINGTVVSIVAIENMSAFRTGLETDIDSSTGMDVDGDEDTTEGTNLVPASGRIPPLVRSPEGVPCILNPDDRKLDPRYSHKLGVALVRGIDSQKKELHMLTPLPASDAIDEVMQQDGVGVVLVSGKFDSPTWAYTEDLFFQNTSKDSGAVTNNLRLARLDADESDAGEDGTLVESAHAPKSSIGATTPGKLSPSEIPWVEALHGGQKRDAGSRVWRVRRDLGRNTNSNGGGE